MIKANEELVKTLPSSMHKLFFRVYSTNRTASKAIKAKCLDCCCYDRDEVKQCTVESCPLYLISRRIFKVKL